MIKPHQTTLALLVLLLGTPIARAQEEDGDLTAIDDQPHITMIGHASARAVPDLATISLGISVEKPGAGEASAEVARVAQGIVEAAKAEGVDPRDIQTQAVTLAQVYDEVRDPAGHVTGSKPRGFSAGTTLAVRTRALDKVGALAQSLVEHGATRIDGIRFSLEHPEAVMDTILTQATRDAQHRASLAASALGAKLGRVLLIERPEAGSRPAGRALSRAAGGGIEPGTQTLRSEIEVTWSLQP